MDTIRRSWAGVSAMLLTIIVMIAAALPAAPASAATADSLAKSAGNLMSCMRDSSFCVVGDRHLVGFGERASFTRFVSESGFEGHGKIIVMDTSKDDAGMRSLIDGYFKDTSMLDKTQYGLMVIVYKTAKGRIGYVTNGTDANMVKAFGRTVEPNLAARQVKGGTAGSTMESLKPGIRAAVANDAQHRSRRLSMTVGIGAAIVVGGFMLAFAAAMFHRSKKVGDGRDAPDSNGAIV
jgi:hypothetical protein